MSKQTRFTVIKNGKMYLSEEVDTYIEMLRGAYQELSEEMEELKRQSVKEKEQSEKDKESLKSELEKVQALLADKPTQVDNVDMAKIKGLEKANSFLEEKLKKYTNEKETLTKQVQQYEKEKNACEAQLKKQTEEFKKQAEEIRTERQARRSAEAKLSKLEEISNEKEGDSSLEIELEDEREKNIRLQRKLDSERRKTNQLQADKKQLEEESFKKTDEGKAEAYISLLERTTDMSDAYVQDIESKMNQLHEGAKASAEEALSSANEQAAKVLEEANSKAEAMIAGAEEKSSTMLSEASKKRNEAMARAKAEYDGIRNLIEKASKEYVEMASNTSKDRVDWD